MTAGQITRTFPRPLAPIAAIVLLTVFIVGMIAGLAVSPALRGLGSAQAVVTTVASDEASVQAHLSFLRGEEDSYPANDVQAHLSFLRGEEDSYGK